MKSKRKLLQMLAAGVLSAALLAGPAQAADPEIRVSSWKGSTLEAGERSGLVIDPAGPEYTASSSNPEVVAVEQVLTFWVAVAKAEGTAEITVTNEAGTTSRLVLTVGVPEAEPVPAPTPVPSQTVDRSIDLSANMEIRQEMIRLINQVRRANGVAELEVNESLMNAAQYCSGHQFRIHGRHEWQALKDYGWPHGGSFNLTYFMASEKQDIAQTAINNWIDSPGHYQTLLCSSAACVGTGVYQTGGMVYCHMVAGDPNSYSPL